MSDDYPAIHIPRELVEQAQLIADACTEWHRVDPLGRRRRITAAAVLADAIKIGIKWVVPPLPSALVFDPPSAITTTKPRRQWCRSVGPFLRRRDRARVLEPQERKSSEKMTTKQAAETTQVFWIVNESQALRQIGRDDKAVAAERKQLAALEAVNQQRLSVGLNALVPAPRSEREPPLVLGPGLNVVDVDPQIEPRFHAELASIPFGEIDESDLAPLARTWRQFGLSRVDPMKVGAREAVELAGRCCSRIALKRWREVEKRTSVLAAIDARLDSAKLKRERLLIAAEERLQREAKEAAR